MTLTPIKELLCNFVIETVIGETDFLDYSLPTAKILLSDAIDELSPINTYRRQQEALIDELQKQKATIEQMSPQDVAGCLCLIEAIEYLQTLVESNRKERENALNE